MDYKTILELCNNQDWEELEKQAKDMPAKDLQKELEKLEQDQLVHVLPKLPTEIATQQFLLFSPKIQGFLVENISDIAFETFPPELLEIDDIENKLTKAVFSEILIRGQSDATNKKLIEIIDNIKNFA